MDTKTKIEWALKMLKDQMKNLKNSVSEGEQTPKNTALKLSELLTQIEEIERLNNNV